MKTTTLNRYDCTPLNKGDFTMELPKGYVSRKKTFIPPLKGTIQDKKWSPPIDAMKPDPTNYAPVVHNCGLAGCRPMRLRLKTVASFIATAKCRHTRTVMSRMIVVARRILNDCSRSKV